VRDVFSNGLSIFLSGHVASNNLSGEGTDDYASDSLVGLYSVEGLFDFGLGVLNRKKGFTIVKLLFEINCLINILIPCC